MFSTEAWLDAPGNYLMVRAFVGAEQAYPETNNLYITTAGTERGSYAVIFYRENVGPGTHTVRIQWRVWFAGTGNVNDRSLVVIGLPA
jgi:hypothetical protein